jgi:hypothetical protein
MPAGTPPTSLVAMVKQAHQRVAKKAEAERAGLKQKRKRKQS